MNDQVKSQAAGTPFVATPAQRAAIVIAMLGETAARPIMEKLDDASLARVNQALETIKLIPKRDLTQVVLEFLTELRQTSGELLGGKVHARELIANIVEFRQESLDAQSAPADAPDTGKPVIAATVWGQMAAEGAESVATYLNGLSPNLASLILRRVETTFSSEVLNFLDDDKLQPIMERLIEPDNSDEGIVSVIERMVEMEFLNTETGAATEDDEHLAGIGEILSLIPTDKRNSLVAFLRSNHEAKLESIEKALFTLDALPDLLPRNAVSVVFREYGTPQMTELLATFSGELEVVSEYFLTNISSRLSDQIREEVPSVPAMEPDEAEGVQRKFLLALMTMKRKGVIEMNDKPKPAAASA
ncbi:MAG: FliG C-terminal domain-containing protein [Hyphomonas sp.]